MEEFHNTAIKFNKKNNLHHIFNKLITIPNNLDEKSLVKDVLSNGLNIFQQNTITNVKINDNKRKQLVGIEKILGPNKLDVLNICQQVSNLKERFNSKLKQSDVSIILSLPGCMRQSLHMDYDKNKNCYLILVALMPNTSIQGYYNKQIKIELDKGDILFARGDFIHAGDNYDITNVRLHFYWFLGITNYNPVKTFLQFNFLNCDKVNKRYYESKSII